MHRPAPLALDTKPEGTYCYLYIRERQRGSLARLSRQERHKLARTRIERVLRAQTIATMRTLEMKISDAGPNPQRVDPHYLTDARKELQAEGLLSVQQGITNWYHLATADHQAIQQRLAELEPIQRAYQMRSFTLRLGDALEIAVFRSLEASGLTFFGSFPTLNEHDDSQKYRKDEPPGHIGNRTIAGNRKLDFLAHVVNDWVGIECKNVREWLYPDGAEVKELLSKCLQLDCVPVMIARRIQFATFAVFNKCGVIFHQVYNQRVPTSDAALAAQASNKDLLGYFDIRLGNLSDARINKFIATDMTGAVPAARFAFNRHKDLLANYCYGEMSYSEFAARVRRRSHGLNEDRDEPPPDFAEDWML